MFKKQFLAILGKLNFTQKATDNTLTAAEWAQIESAYKEQYNSSIQEDMAKNEAEVLAATQRAQILSVISGTEEGDEGASATTQCTEEGAEGAPAATSTAPDMATVLASIQTILKENTTLRQTNATLAALASPDVPQTTVGADFSVNGPGSTATHLFGIQNDMFDMNKRWNQITVNPAVAALSEPNDEEHGKQFRSEAIKFGRTLAQRYSYLKSNNLLNPAKLNEGFALNSTGLGAAGLGNQYVVRRQDALIARILTLRSVTDLFPVRYGIQDRELITNAFFSEVSQAYQVGAVFKGDMTLEPEFGHVDDAMAKIRFGSMKEIERMYIGYLNTDGSDPVKWSMIEFALLGIYEQMQKEQNKRRITGIYVKPDKGVAGSYLNASTGLVYTLVRYIHENKILTHDDASYADYDESNMYPSIKEFVGDIQASITEDMDLAGYCLYLNYNHKSWWTKGVRAALGKDMDFTGPQGALSIVPDTDIPIKWVPNLGQMKLMFFQAPGNIQFLEFVPGEMFGVKMTEHMEEVQAWATWKEGCGAAFVGRNFATPEALAANNYQLQQVFMNKPCTALSADATTASAAKNFWFRTQANTAAKALIEITGAKPGVAYIIECGSKTNATTISKAGQFAAITAAYAPTTVGDYLMVILNKDGNFLELERCIGGVRTINKDLQPNIPGAR